jgi:hypothetical protein
LFISHASADNAAAAALHLWLREHGFLGMSFSTSMLSVAWFPASVGRRH